MKGTIEEIKALGNRWAEAQVKGDTSTLASMTTDDFTLVGPLGFVVPKETWLEGYRSGALVMKSVDWSNVQVRDYGDTAIAIGCHTQEAAHRGRPVNGRFRVTQVFVRKPDGWRIAGLQFSAITPPPAS